jgi:hypothetical protein
MIAGSRFLGILNTNNFMKIRQNSKSLLGVFIESRISRLMKKNRSQKSHWTVPLRHCGVIPFQSFGSHIRPQLPGFYNIIQQFSFYQAFMSKTPCDWMYSILADFQKFLGVSHSEKAAPPPSHSYCSAGFDWLGVDLEVMSLCYEPTPQIGNQRIEECLYSKYGRSPIGPPDVIRIILISYKVILLISQLLCLGGCFICHI